MFVRNAVSRHSLPAGWEDVAGLCGLLLSPRLEMIMLLADGERDVGQLGRAVGLGQPVATHHLKVLRTAGIVATRREGRRVYYRLHDGGVVASRTALTFHSAKGRVHITVGQPAPAPSPPPHRLARAAGA